MNPDYRYESILARDEELAIESLESLEDTKSQTQIELDRLCEENARLSAQVEELTKLLENSIQTLGLVPKLKNFLLGHVLLINQMEATDQGYGGPRTLTVSFICQPRSNATWA